MGIPGASGVKALLEQLKIKNTVPLAVFLYVAKVQDILETPQGLF